MFWSDITENIGYDTNYNQNCVELDNKSEIMFAKQFRTNYPVISVIPLLIKAIVLIENQFTWNPEFQRH